MVADDDLDTLIDRCAREPIHIPGKIQTHGFLLACDEALVVRYASANVREYLNADAAQLLGQALFPLLRNPGADAEWMSVLDSGEAAVYLGSCEFDSAPARFDVTAHRRAGMLIAEFETPGETLTLASGVSAFVSRLQSAHTIADVCAVAVEEMKRLTGFGRVLAYSFDPDGHGRVLAESIDDGYDSYVGLHFPASDIPAQARELYKLNPIRVIPDAHYQASALLTTPEYRERPLDLSLSSLRSVSPVHVQYMVNMGTLASMSISILVEGQLWGLISCHNHQPRQVSSATRNACELLGKILSLQVEAREGHDQTLRRLELRSMMVNMLAAMADKDSVAAGLCAIPEISLAFAGARGAAVVTGGRCHSIGEVPHEEDLRALAGWLNQRSDRDIHHTDTLGEQFPGTPRSALPAGLLAVSISEIHSNYIMWFRPEVVKTVNWAGEPIKRQQTVNGVETLSPRRSFASWQQIVRGQSLPWSREEIDAAMTLRDSVRGIVLRKAEEIAEMAEELRHANGELEAFSYSVSHDLRAPLRHIAGYAELLQEYESATLSERAMHYLDNIGESVRFAGTLVDELLAFSQMGRSALRPTPVDLAALVNHVRRELAPDYEHRDIEWVVQTLPQLQCDGAFMHLALRNLLANAIKYTRDAAQARIEIGTRSGEGEQIVYVRDNGVGFDMQYVGKLFGVFQRLHSMDEFEGTGIGLANVRRIIERHGGRVWAEGEPGLGATFYFAIPNTIPVKHLSARGAELQG